ncbi:2-C-methyl-D-erythritol 2,4-cyclodiphosphate synthase [Curtobacterium sp. VKM Ac-2865]|uniref:2-C-methyl-D-erythritol 4-phosphate cytidylyltransferase n=1 Tax=Curtobacterium sp. VKM Ac-2865 TaxID=2783817 RepID=UPI001889D03A|nr:2-C-methyl-D-erythritol 4-phosphate cytidylyltransferase [Curtobacterium sp. VKM Ac-2865]MBF4584384.1 2-C-methyl-D-erythritol 2,4-cyclodiphosphate synthase [Curtobacterium sp. VKM Ac-2865]
MTQHSTTTARTDAVRAVVVVAAGSGTRLGIGTAKAFVPVAGRVMLARALEPLFTLAEPVFVVVVAPDALLGQCREIVDDVAGVASAYTAVVAGGVDRHASVQAGLAALPPSVESVLVHDAARCLTPASQFQAVFDAVAQHGCGIVPALPVTDTVKRVSDDVVLETVDRSSLVGVQTPQGFPLSELRAAYATSTQSETDDAGVFQAAGGTVRFVPGDADAFKITTAWDLRRAEAVVAGGAGLSVRVGLGMDVHAFDATAPCRVGLLDFPGEPGLAGHSDGDAVAHAVCDALLSAGGLGDIGSRFGTSDPAYAGATGDVFVRGAVQALASMGLRPERVTVQVIGNHPRIGARREEMQDALAAVVGAPVAVSGTTTDGLGFTGRGEGLAAIATAVVHRA